MTENLNQPQAENTPIPAAAANSTAAETPTATDNFSNDTATTAPASNFGEMPSEGGAAAPTHTSSENAASTNTTFATPAANAAATSTGAGFFSRYLDSLKQIWHGTGAYNILPTAKTNYGLIALGICVLEFALLVSLMFARGMGFADLASSLTRSLFSDAAPSIYFVIGFGSWLGIFVLLLISFAAIIALRVLTLRIPFALRSVETNFAQLSAIYAYSLAPIMALLPIVLFFVLLPLPQLNLILFPLFFLIFAVCALLAEILLYIGVNRAGKFSKSPLIPHISSFAAWLVVTNIIMFIALMIISGIFYADYSSAYSSVDSIFDTF